MKKVRKKTVVIIACATAAAIVCGIAANGFFSPKVSAAAISVSASEATATKGDISNTVSGTGTLTLEGDTDIKIPSGITIEETKVKSGQEVKAGDVLATVNMLSVYSAIETVQNRISTLDTQIAEAQSNTSASSVTAGVAGTVTKLYASVGTDVYSCIAQYGSLMEITTSDGSVIKVISSGGTVNSIAVAEGSSVSSSTAVLTVMAGSSDASYKSYIAEREELTEQLGELLKIESSGTITATADGIIADVNVSSSSSSSSSATATATSLTVSKTGASTLSATGTSNTAFLTSYSNAVLLTEKTDSDIPQDSDSEDTGEDTNGSDTSKDDTSGSDTDGSKDDSDGSGSDDKKDGSSDTDSENKKLSFSIVSSEKSTSESLGILSPAKNNKVMTEIKASDGSYTGTVTWTPSGDSFQADTVYQANVKLTANDGYCFTGDSISGIESGIVSGLKISDGGKTISFTISYPAYTDGSSDTDSKKDGNTDTDKSSSDKDNEKSDDTDSIMTDDDDYSAYSFSSGSSDAGSYSVSGTSSSSSDTGSTGSSSTSSTVTAFTLSTSGNLSVSVSVDELDINSMSVGQEATITLDAIENQSFTGTVSSIANSASSSNGVAKYTVKLTIPKDDQMKIGMNASVSIVTSESKDVITIPVAALQERGDETYVYTKADENGNLSGEVTVTTGLSDGTNVEITDGLEEGTTVYYLKTDSSDSGSFDFDMSDIQFDDAGGGMQGGDMPSGGMPSGGDQ